MSLIRRLPKADLHSHIDGSIPASELYAIAERHGRGLTTPSGRKLRAPEDLMRHLRGNGYSSMLEEIVDRFYPIVGLMQTEEILRDVGSSYVGTLKAQNVSYAEGRFAPQYHTREGLTLRQAIESMADGLAEGAEKYGVNVNLIVAIGRETAPEKGIAIARAAIDSGKAVALDLGGPEENNPPEKFRKAFQAATAAHLKKTVHAGEGAGSKSQGLANIWTAVELLQADRVGHATDAWRDPALVDLLGERHVALEMNPVSNLILRKIRNVKDLGIDRLMRSGLGVTVNSDDPALWPGGSVNEALRKVCSAYGFGFEELDRLITNSFECSFTAATEKQRLLDEYSHARRSFA
jgi:adenosine deaminase